MTLRKVLSGIALVIIAVSIYLMKPDATEQVVPEAPTAEVVENTADRPAPIPAAVHPMVERTAPVESATPAPDSGTLITKEIPGDPGEPPLIPAFTLQKGVLPWEKRINEVLNNKTISESDKARLLLEMLPGLPIEARETAAEDAVQRLANADYRYAQNVVTNPATYPPALATMWADLMGRPEAISLPTLLQVARNSSHPYAESARENLELLIGHDYGTDWPRWETAIREKLTNK